ncbi:MAG: dITP/XTP pyrophosphatase [Firmicutes bacterium ADurb.Bin182]|nr:MAG: dITP/XTP pyrophosphatase [Firmicutes bacterium ADurb.Bin182]
MKLVIASDNKNKIREIKQILHGFFDEMLSMREAGIDMDIVEDGSTFSENALKKAEGIFRIANADAVLADDSGLVVDALNGAPGVYSARFAGEGHNDEANNKKLLKLMENVPQNLRTCRFETAVALLRKGKPPLIATGTCEGRLLFEPKGNNGFGYDPIFYTETYKMSFAQCTAEQKNAVSHRGNALKALRKMLEDGQ